MQKAFWTTFGAATVVYLTMVLWSLPYIAQEAGGLMPFDVRPMGYSVAEAQEFVSALSPAGRAFYLGTQHTLDIVYPALIGLVLVLGVQLLFKAPVSSVLSIIALMASASDYLENYLIASVLSEAGAMVDANLVNVASVLTVSKSVGQTICFVAMFLGAGRSLWLRVVR